MKRPILVVFFSPGVPETIQCLAWPNGETIVGNDVSVQITAPASSGVLRDENYRRKNDRSAASLLQNGATAAFDCVKAK